MPHLTAAVVRPGQHPDPICCSSCGVIETGAGETGAGAAILGDRGSAVAWLANTLGARGVALESDHLILTGVLLRATDVERGDLFEAEFDRLGAVGIEVV